MPRRNHSPEWAAIVRQLHIRRLVLGLTQTQAGALAATSKGAVANLECGLRVPTAETLIRLAAAYGLRVALVPEADLLSTKEPAMPQHRSTPEAGS